MTTPVLRTDNETRDWSLESDLGREEHQRLHDRLAAYATDFVASGPGPASHGLVAWPAAPIQFASHSPAAGAVSMCRLPLGGTPRTLSKVWLSVVNGAAGVGSTVGLYDAAGNRIGVSADISSVVTGRAVYGISVGTVVVPDDYVWAAVHFGTTTGPTCQALSDAFGLLGVGPATTPSGARTLYQASVGSLPTTLTLASMSRNALVPYLAVS